MGRVLLSAITLASCLSARPNEDRSDPPHVLTGFSGGGIYGTLLELGPDAMITTDQEGLIQEANGDAVLYLLMQKERGP